MMPNFFDSYSKAEGLFESKQSFTLLETLVALSIASILITVVISFSLFAARIKENAIIKMEQKLALWKAFSIHKHNEIIKTKQNGIIIVPEIEHKTTDQQSDYINWMVVPEERKALAIFTKFRKIESPAQTQAGLSKN